MLNKLCMGEQETKQTKNAKTVSRKLLKVSEIFFKLEIKMKQLNRIIRDIRILFKHEDDYYKSIRADNFWNNNYIEYESKLIEIQTFW